MYTLKLNLPPASPLKLLLWNFLSQWMLSSCIKLPQSTLESSETPSFPFLYPSSIQSTSVPSILLIQYFSCISISLYLLCYYVGPHHLPRTSQITSLLQSILYTMIKIISLNANLLKIFQYVSPSWGKNSRSLGWNQALHAMALQAFPASFCTIPQQVPYVPIPGEDLLFCK